MVGYRSKKLMADRHADPITLDHIIELRKKLAIAEAQRDNALAVATRLQREKDRLIAEIKSIADHDQLGHLK